MKLFRCRCGDRPVLYFENTSCGACGALVGFDPTSRQLGPFDPANAGKPNSPGGASDLWQDAAGARFRLCANRTRHAACNWMVAAEQADPWCLACRRNVLIPDLKVAANLAPWKTLEVAKRRCLFTLLELDFPLDADDGMPALAFRFLADRDSRSNFESPLPDTEPVMTGHEEGVITINLAEADMVARSRMQATMAERYRTPLGHFRHECGHYAWDRLAARDAGFAVRSRTLFGDEREDYGAALQRHYASGSPADWERHHVSAYATMHPFEDWAETWSHYLHIIDTLETQQSFANEIGLVDAVRAAVPLPVDVGFGNTADQSDFNLMMTLWVDVSALLNSLNRSMGMPDPYPFVLGLEVRRKLGFVHAELLALHARQPAVLP